MSRTISISIDKITEKVQRSLYIIGKRSSNDDGTSLFQDVSLSTNETDLISDYVYVAFQHIQTELAKFVTISQVEEHSTENVFISAEMSVDDNSGSLTLDKTVELYCVSYALYSWFVFSVPRIADKYNRDCETLMADIIRIVHNKKEPEASADDYEDGVTTSIA